MQWRDHYKTFKILQRPWSCRKGQRRRREPDGRKRLEAVCRGRRRGGGNAARAAATRATSAPRRSWRVLPADLSCCLMRLRVAGQRGALCPGLALRRGPTGSGPSPLAHPVALRASAYVCGEQSGHLPERCSGNAGPTVPTHTAHLPS